MNFLEITVLYSSFYRNQPLDDSLLSQYHLTTNDGRSMKTIAVCQNHMTYQVKVYLTLSNTRIIPHWPRCCISSSSPVLVLCHPTHTACPTWCCPVSLLLHPARSVCLLSCPLSLLFPFSRKSAAHADRWKQVARVGLAQALGYCPGGWREAAPDGAQCHPVLQHPSAARPVSPTVRLAEPWRLAKDKIGEDICPLPLKSHRPLI